MKLLSIFISLLAPCTIFSSYDTKNASKWAKIDTHKDHRELESSTEIVNTMIEKFPTFSVQEIEAFHKDMYPTFSETSKEYFLKEIKKFETTPHTPCGFFELAWMTSTLIGMQYSLFYLTGGAEYCNDESPLYNRDECARLKNFIGLPFAVSGIIGLKLLHRNLTRRTFPCENIALFNKLLDKE